MAKEVYDPIASGVSSYQDLVDEYKFVPRFVIFLMVVAYIWAIYTGQKADIVYQTGMFLSVMTITYVIGVDSLKDIVDALLKNKGINIPGLSPQTPTTPTQE